MAVQLGRAGGTKAAAGLLAEGRSAPSTTLHAMCIPACGPIGRLPQPQDSPCCENLGGGKERTKGATMATEAKLYATMVSPCEKPPTKSVKRPAQPRQTAIKREIYCGKR
jgi:hypothetical protein